MKLDLGRFSVSLVAVWTMAAIVGTAVSATQVMECGHHHETGGGICVEILASFNSLGVSDIGGGIHNIILTFDFDE